MDNQMLLGANHPMGPLELADFISLDVCCSVMQVLYDGLADTKYRPCPLLAKYVEAGWLGRKSGRGFYDYSGETPVPTRLIALRCPRALHHDAFHEGARTAPAPVPCEKVRRYSSPRSQRDESPAAIRRIHVSFGQHRQGSTI